MVTLGLHAFTHDSAAALAVDGRLVAFHQEERLSRIKGDGAFPTRAIEFCLGEGGIDPAAVDLVVLPFRPGVGAVRRLAYQLRRPRRGLGATASLLAKGRANLGLSKELRALGIDAPIRRTDHHQSHAWAVFMASGFESAAILVIDGVAEAWSGGNFVAHRRPAPAIDCRNQIPFPASLGLIYAAVTEHLGFRHNREEGKVMAMAASGTDEMVTEMGAACRLDGDRLVINHDLFDFGGAWTTDRFADIFCPRRSPSEPIQPRHFALARAVQNTVESVATRMARRLLDESGERHLCLAGGLALNPALNSAIAGGCGADDVYALPVGGDAGTAIGAALALDADPDWRLQHAFWGSTPSPEAIDHALAGAGLKPSMVGEGVVARTAELLAEGSIGGWFRGSSEMGPRALGHRSIFADPRSPASRTRLNQDIKRREAFQPFGPSILLEACDEIFPGLGPSPFMLRTWPVADTWRERIPAVIHTDGTSRPQTVTAGDGSELHDLLRAFADRTGLPVLLNTSLNRRGEPLAEHPEDAIAVFLETGLDFLVLEDRLIIWNEGAT